MIRLDDTTGNAVAAAIASERHRMGSPTTGMVLTLLILADESTQADATRAAMVAAREHPMRILTVIPRPGREPHRLDAEVAVGGEDGPGEVAVLRLRGDLAEHAGSVCIPLLLSDTPVVAWWPTDPPPVPADDPIGVHAQRRITDAAFAGDPRQALAARRDGYQPGDTDLAWTRLTPWRTVLAAMFDQPTEPVTGGSILAESGNASALLMASWLQDRLGVPIDLVDDDGPGLTSVTLTTADGDLVVDRADGRVAVLRRPGQPDSHVALPRRELHELIAEELRRLDPDDVYAEALDSLDLRGPRVRRAAGEAGG
ncbi:MAG: glucose-6-phosphate dehydrogenase assembly protein OpcA [Candidatus Nanopelagicales bacterium]